MAKNLIPLNQLPIGSFGKVKRLTAEGISRRRMLDLGLIFNTTVESLRKSPAGDPIAYEIRGAVIALRSEEASKIYVEVI
ncbi:FeoA family protein [Alkaliphilus hydrothermalis]|uniref:Ferrous iron transport protein A n=1 Tax=Alkaliphilus hydrothermalis TaxID=1482730 RepID=A0ABS2NKM6_9FIRM|nr:FeoA family protein [Alkaliphilus hydrothermalis]MBM7613495.1 ferrous iron transport protein A [Alkaliphilus hydrothermalis]